jgi:hypothetical protein
MTSVTLHASGYTWNCPECGRENYTGAAPASVHCAKCNGDFQVQSLHHRHSDPQDSKRNGKHAGGQEETMLMPLFSLQATQPLPPPGEDEIPF